LVIIKVLVFSRFLSRSTFSYRNFSYTFSDCTLLPIDCLLIHHPKFYRLDSPSRYSILLYLFAILVISILSPSFRGVPEEFSFSHIFCLA
jgi:hypothetical protein